MRKNFNYYKLKQSLMLLKELENPISSFMYYIGIKDTVTVKTKKIGSYDFDSSNRDLCHSLLLSLPYLNENNIDICKDFFLQCCSKNEIITLPHFKVLNDQCGIFSEQFIEYPYLYKNAEEGKTIIDIGSNVGDTVLDFASKGLVVYGFEPVKDLYELSLRNIELNPDLKDNVHLYNYAVSYKNGKITISNMKSTSDYIEGNESYEIDVISLGEIINRYNIEPQLLKIDCEGCEFDIIKNFDMSLFEEIILEHHANYRNEDYENLVGKLIEYGFKVDLIPLWIFDMDDFGIIHAYKE